MVTLNGIDINNWIEASLLSCNINQRNFVANGMEILARAYVNRDNNAEVYTIYDGDMMVGIVLIEELIDEPACYHLYEYLIDHRYQGRGYGSESIKLILNKLREEKKFERVEVCVHSENMYAIKLFTNNGFTFTDYIDFESPWNKFMICEL